MSKGEDAVGKVYKVAVMGKGGVGKSALTVMFVQDVFLTKYDPTIEDSYRKQVEVDGEHIMLEILDTAGTEHFTAMRDLYMKHNHGFLLVYSITAISTFNDLEEWRDQILRIKDNPNVPIILVGNKADCVSDRQVPTEKGQELAKKWNCLFFETSAKTKYNLNEVFIALVREIKKFLGNTPEPTSNTKQRKRRVCLIL